MEKKRAAETDKNNKEDDQKHSEEGTRVSQKEKEEEKGEKRKKEPLPNVSDKEKDVRQQNSLNKPQHRRLNCEEAIGGSDHSTSNKPQHRSEIEQDNKIALAIDDNQATITSRFRKKKKKRKQEKKCQRRRVR